MRVNPVKKTNIQGHNVIVLDASMSMGGSKYDNAKIAVLREFELSKTLGYTFSFIEFVHNNNVITHFLKETPSLNVERDIKFNGATGYNTPLYQTIINTLSSLLQDATSNDRFLVKFITDGQENVNGLLKHTALFAIKDAEQRGCTITFTCVEQDKPCILEIGVDESNIITYDNTGEDLERSFQETQSATIRYSKNLIEGKDVTLGFYNKTLNK